jgi:Protein of unknown function (DUF3616).
MTEGFLLSRTLLRLRSGKPAIETTSNGDLSALAWADTSAGRVLWLGIDEALGVGGDGDAARKAPRRNAILTLRADRSDRFVLSDVTLLRDVLPQFPFIVEDDDEGEVDIEGLDLVGDHLWLVGSHSSRRRTPRRRDRTGERLSQVSVDDNRFLLARLNVHDGVIATSPPGDPSPSSAVLLPKKDGNPNPLIDALADDDHLKPFLRTSKPLPGKDNGFDIEGLAVRKDRVYLGLRGPVLRGWATILALEPKESGTPGRLKLTSVGEKGPLVAKHFLYLGGMGIRDLAFDGDDLLILAGPTMDMDGIAAVWRLKRPDQLADLSLTGKLSERETFDADRLQRLFDLPTVVGADRPEGLTRYEQWGEAALMIVHDRAAAARHPMDNEGNPKPHAVFADIFRL